MFDESATIPVRIPDAPSSLIPDGSAVMVVGSVELVGVLTLERSGVALDYQVHVAGFEWTSPAQRVEIPFDAVSAVRVTGGWWRPTLEMRIRQPGAVAPLGLGRDGCLRFRIARSQRRHARELAADAALRAAERVGDVAPRSLPETDSDRLPQSEIRGPD